MRGNRPSTRQGRQLCGAAAASIHVPIFKTTAKQTAQKDVLRSLQQCRMFCCTTLKRDFFATFTRKNVQRTSGIFKPKTFCNSLSWATALSCLGLLEFLQCLFPNCGCYSFPCAKLSSSKAVTAVTIQFL